MTGCRNRGSVRRAHSRNGFALVAVLWMVAALSILAAGLISATRSEVRVAHLARSTSTVAAIGDAAIQLAALELRSTPDQPAGFRTTMIEFDGTSVEVGIVPAGGLIDLNAASESLLRDLFIHGAQREEGAAEQLAQRIVDWRSPERVLEDPDYEAAGVAFRPRRGVFEYPEDLLQVLGVSYDDYDKIQRFITVLGGGAGVDPMAAPEGVLRLLAGGDASLAARIADLRVAGDPLVDLTGLVQEHLGGGGAQIYRMDAVVDIDGRRLRRTRWIDLGLPGADGSPWRTTRVEAVVGEQVQAEFDDGI